MYKGWGTGHHDQDQDTNDTSSSTSNSRGSTNFKDTMEGGGCRCKKATVSETVMIEMVTITLPQQPTMRAIGRKELTMTKTVRGQQSKTVTIT